MHALQVLAADDPLGGLFAGAFGLFLLVLGIAWLIFPLIVISKFNELLRVQRHATLQIQDAVARIAIIQQGKTDTVKALQWMLDNWPSKGPAAGPPEQPQDIYRID